MKICAKCKEQKPKSDYYPKASAKSGFRSRCIECERVDRALTAESAAIYRKEKVEQKKAYDKKRRAEKAAAIAVSKRLDYEKNKERYDLYRKQWAKDNPEKQIAISKAASFRRRAAMIGKISTREFNEWVESQPKNCYWCEKKNLEKYEIDHYYPLSKGGSHSIDNLVISCQRCNRTKHAKDPHEYAAKFGRLF